MTITEIMFALVAVALGLVAWQLRCIWLDIRELWRLQADMERAWLRHCYPDPEPKQEREIYPVNVKKDGAPGTMTPAMKHAISLGGAAVKIRQFPDHSFHIFSVDAEGGETEMYLCPRCGQYGFPTAVISDNVCTACANEIRGLADAHS